AEADENRTRRTRVAARPTGFEVRAGHQPRERFHARLYCTLADLGCFAAAAPRLPDPWARGNRLSRRIAAPGEGGVGDVRACARRARATAPLAPSQWPAGAHVALPWGWCSLVGCRAPRDACASRLP